MGDFLIWLLSSKLSSCLISHHILSKWQTFLVFGFMQKGLPLVCSPGSWRLADNEGNGKDFQESEHCREK